MYAQCVHWLNYHHLYYFWLVAREGTIARAASLLHLTQPTVSGQIRHLERQLKTKLLERQGRYLVPTDAGRIVFGYADEIFSLGKELQDVLRGRPAGKPLRLLVGAAPTLPKTVAYRLLKPVLELPEPVQIVYDEGRPDYLLAQLALNAIDVVLADVPASPTVKVRVFNHLLGECGASFFAPSAMSKTFRANFPRSLDGAPFLLPGEGSALRQGLDQWFESEGIRPKVRGEFSDSAMLKVFGAEGVGIFAAPTIVEDEVQRQYHVRPLGRIPSIRERFYAISAERKLKHPAVVAITDSARQTLFAK
jgi:LysR family transcriptional activator of nhaA